MNKAAETAAVNRARREAKAQLKKELLELMILSLQTILKDEDISTESRLQAVTLVDELRKELRL